MGKYNNQYESYYAKILEQRKNQGNYLPYANYEGSNRESTKESSFWVRRLFQELIGVLCLFVFVILCKTVNTPETLKVYKFSKETINQNFDYKKYMSEDYAVVLDKLKFKSNTSLRDNLESYVETFKSKVTGDKTLNEKTKESFIKPIQGKIDEESGKKLEDNGVVFEAPENTEIIAAFDGTIKKIGEENLIGKYLVIDHGNGIETRYGSIKETIGKEGDKIEKGELIAKSGSSSKLGKSCLIFNFIYMGENKMPQDYIVLN
ncbi:peptidase M23 [Clostridium polyendosporum]|uniref:Peptidase M23 n=1 Tax=Clostridium polyendosporum TaxID=69208 RepID=A0A919RZ53_9CLOT|nr:M23 family metallopeptidase [Clostridium polyendosporum]GIM29210.1 peptidase M23 [Clostridium polyendosporum]